MPLFSELDTATLNMASPTVPRRALEQSFELASAKPTVVLPSAAEMGHHARRASKEEPAYQPKQWVGVSALALDDEISTFKSAPLNSPDSMAKAAAQLAVRVSTPKESAPAVLPTHELARKSRMSKEENTSPTPEKLPAWAGISNTLVDPLNSQPSPDRHTEERRGFKQAEAEAETVTDSDRVVIPGSRELMPSARPPARRASAPTDATNTLWVGLSRFSDHATPQDSPPLRRHDNQQKAAPVLLPSSLELQLEMGLMARSRTVPQPKTASYGDHSNTQARWMGVSPAIALE